MVSKKGMDVAEKGGDENCQCGIGNRNRHTLLFSSEKQYDADL
jgi:hypothetical protein